VFTMWEASSPYGAAFCPSSDGRTFPASMRTRQFGNQFRLDLLDFQEPMPLVIDQLIHLPVHVADLELGLQIDLVVVLGPQPILGFLPILTHMMT